MSAVSGTCVASTCSSIPAPAIGAAMGTPVPASMVSSRTSRRTSGRMVFSRVSGDGSSLPTIISASCRAVTLEGSATSPTVRPARMTVIASALPSTSSSLCEMKMTVAPCSVRSRRDANSSSTSCGTRTAVGSSRIRMRAPR